MATAATTRPVDEKIVVMKLDNSDFKRKAIETTSTFGRMRDSLGRFTSVNVGKTAQELGKIQNAANNTNLNRLTSSVETVASRFSNMGVVATTALATISSMATTAGTQLVKSLTLDQVTDGFGEYETKIGAIGTMLANTEWAGSDLDDVKKTLGQLNDYADQTIYNFEEMVSSIGRFTAAGVTLEDSAIAIKGLGNLAAVSGSSSEQLNTAMYQMSQALASGKLTLEDWNSMVNAGMAGKKTQDALVETARAMGKNVDLSEGFRNSIQKGWLTSEVMLETLKKFGADKSMTKAATSVRTFTGMIASLKEGIGSGWATTFEHMFGDFDEATKFWTNMSNSIGGWFAKASEERNNLVEGVANRGGFLNMFAGIQNGVKPIMQVFKSLGDGFKRVFPPATADGISKMAIAFKNFTAGLSLSGGTMGKLTTIFQGAFSVLSTIFEIAKRVGKAFLQIIPPGLGGSVLDTLVNIANLAIGFNQSVKDGNGLTATIDGLGKALSTIGQGTEAVIDSVINFAASLKDNLGTAVNWIKEKLAPLGKVLKEVFSGFGGDDLLGAGTLVGIATVIGTVIGKINGLFGGFEDIVDGFADAIGGVGDALQNFAMGIKIANLMLIAIAVGILAASLKTLEGIKTEDINKGITALAISLGVMIGGMMLMDKFNVTGGLRASITIIALATAVSTMADALKKISDLNPDQLQTGLTGLIAITGTLAVAMIAMSKWGGKVKAGSLQLLALAGAVYILASAVQKMASIDAGSLFTSIGALALIFAQMAIFLKVVDKAKLRASSAIGIVLIAGAIHLMVSAIQRIDGIDTNGLVKGLTTIAIILAQVAIFSKLVSPAKLTLASAGLLIMAVAINALILPIKTFSKMSWDEIARGLTTMSFALLAMAAAGMLASGSIGGAIAIVAMAVALNMLIIPIQSFASLTWGELLIGLVGLGASLAVIAGAAVLLSPAVPAMLAFGAAVLVIGVAVLAAGAGVALFATGLGALATMTLAAVASIVASLGLMIKGLAELIPAFVDFVVKVGLALINGILKLVPPLVEAVVVLIIRILETLTSHLPKFIELGSKLIIQLLEGLGKEVPRLIDAAIKFVIQLVEGMSQAIRDNGPQLISAVLELVGEIVLLIIEAGIQVINALFGWLPGVKGAMAEIGKGAEKAVRDNFGAKSAGSDKGRDFATSLSNKSGEAKNAGAKVGQAGKDGANAANLKTVGGSKGSDFASALGAKTGAAKSSGTSLANAGKQGAGSVSMTSTGSHFGSGFASGIESEGVMSKIAGAARRIAARAKAAVEGWLDINSPSRVMRETGGFFGEGFALGISDQANQVGSHAKGLAVTAKDSLNRFLDGFELPDVDNEIHFKAVVDYDQLDASRFGNLKPVSIAPNTSLTSSMIPTPKPAITTPDVYGQNGNNNTAMLNKQEQQLGMLQKQIELLSGILNKDNSTYLDGKEMYNSVKNVQDKQTNIRNIFKGVSRV